MRSMGVTGVTNWTSATSRALSAARRSAHSSYGRSGTMKPLTPARAASSGKSLEAEGEQRIQIAHEQQRRFRLAAGRIELLENPAQRHALLQRHAARALDGHAVGHRIGERHADLDDVGRFADGVELFAKVCLRRESRR